MAKKFPGFYLYFDWIEAMEILSAKQSMTIIRNLRNYARDGIEPPPMEGYAGSLQTIFLAQMRRSVINAQNGSLGGQASRKNAALTKETPPSKNTRSCGMSPEEIHSVGFLDYLKIKARFDAEAEGIADPAAVLDGEEPSSPDESA